MSFSLLSIFAGGLLTFASPCVLPLMPVYLATIAGNSLPQAKPRRTLAAAVAFTMGLSIVFVLLGALASSVGGLLVRYRTEITLGSGVLMALFGLRALGWLRIGALDRDVRPGLVHLKTASNLGGALLFGAAFALGWSPCIGPVLASVLTYTATHTESPWGGAGYLAVYAAGLSAPLLALAIGASHVSAWLKRFRRVVPRLEKATGIGLIVVGSWSVFGVVASTPSVDAPDAAPDALRSSANEPSPAEAASCDADGNAGHACALPEIVGEITGERTGAGDIFYDEMSSRPHILEFTADACPVCQRMRPVMEKVTHACDALRSRIVRVDVATARGRALADRHAVHGTPTLVLVDKDGLERARIVGEKSAEEVARAAEAAFGLSCDPEAARKKSPG